MNLKLGSLQLLLIVQLAFWLREGVISPVFALYIRRMGFSVTDIGILMLVRSLGWAIFEPLFGMFADRLGKKRLLIYSMVTSSLMYISYTFATNMSHFYIIIFVMSSFSAAGAVSSRAIITELLPSSGRGKAYGRYMAVLSMGRMAGPLLGGFLTDLISYNAPFYFSGSLGIIGIAAAIPLRYNELPKEKIMSQELILNTRLLTKSFYSLLLIRLLFMFNMNFERNLLPIYLNESQNFKASETQIGIYMGIIQFSSGLSQLFLGEMTDRIGTAKLMFYGLGITGLSYVSLFFLYGPIPLYLLGALQGIFFAATDLSMMIHLMTITPQKRTSRAMGAYGFSEDIGGMIASLSLGIVYDRAGPNFSVLSVSSILIISSIFSTILIKRNKNNAGNS